MKTKSIAVLFAIAISTTAISQDVIIFKNGNEKKVKVFEVSPKEIKYKSFDNPEGPTYTDQKSTIFMIKYENGMKDVFNEEVKNEGQNAQPIVSQPVVQPTPIVEVSKAVETVKTPVNDDDTEDMLDKKERSYGGPRMGVTFIDGGAYRNMLVAEGKRNVYSQFGWQFEKRMFTTDNGISAMIEFVPMIGGLDMGKFIPSASVLIGIRTKQGIELGAGPNVAIYGYKNEKGYYNTASSFGVVFAAGMSFKSGKVYFPVNLAFIPSVGKKATYVDSASGKTVSQKYETGAKLSLLVGFNYRKK